MTTTFTRLGWAALFSGGALFPLITGNDYHLTVMATAYVFAIATLGLNLITGYTGQFNLAHGGFMAIGAYTMGILTVDHHAPYWLAFALSGVVPVVLGLFVGALSLRLKGHYFSIFTMCIGVIIALVIEKWDGLTHGAVGIIGIPVVPTMGSVAFDSPRALYYLVYAFLVVATWAMHRIVNSLLGRTYIAIRNDEALAEALGIHVMRNKVVAFMISVFYAGVAGGLYAGFVRFIGPGLAEVDHTFNMTMYMVIGGLGTLLGPLLGALMVPWITQYLQFLQEYRFIIFGPLLVALVIFMPNGLVGTVAGWWSRRREARRRVAGIRPSADGARKAEDANA
jgi:branched-chain amino acid transport system permease protein